MGDVCSRRSRNEEVQHGAHVLEEVVAGSTKGTSWSCENSMDLCAEGEEDLFKGKAMLLDRSVSTKASAVDMLNRGIIECLDEFCVVHSMTRGRYILLYQVGCKQKALESLGMDAQELELAAKKRAVAEQGGYVITLDKTLGVELGVQCELLETSIMVREIHGGLIEAWNKAHPEEMVGAGDQIVEVNGKQGDSRLLVEELKKPQALMVVLARAVEPPEPLPTEDRAEAQAARSVSRMTVPEAQQSASSSSKEQVIVAVTPPTDGIEFNIVLNKTEGDSLGVSVRPDDPTGTLVIEDLRVNDGTGLVSAWNEANPELAVQPGDRFLEVNGARGSTNALISECKKICPLHIVVFREKLEAPTPL